MTGGDAVVGAAFVPAIRHAASYGRTGWGWVTGRTERRTPQNRIALPFLPRSGIVGLRHIGNNYVPYFGGELGDAWVTRVEADPLNVLSLSTMTK